MPDSPDFTPPPAEPMPEDVRARITQRLHAEVGAARPGRRPTWLAPGLAAAGVLAVVGGTFVATTLDGGGDGGGSSVQPADNGGDGAPVPATTTDGVPDASTPPGTPQPTAPPETAVPTSPGDVSATGSGAPDPSQSSCEDEVASWGGPALQGASVTAERAYGAGTTYLFETKSAWVVCDDLAASDGGAATLTAVHQKERPYEPDLSTLAVSNNWVERPNGSGAYEQFVAAGRDFDGVQAVSYAFPDGHTEDAVVGENGLWSMSYLATDGVFMDKDVNTYSLDPIEVTVRYTGGETEQFTLRWGQDTCAQINHGC